MLFRSACRLGRSCLPGSGSAAGGRRRCHTVHISDAIGTLGHLFLGTGILDCLEAADTDNNGAVDITDVVFSLGYQFLGQDPPAAPGPLTCGPDPTDPFLGCNRPCE